MILAACDPGSCPRSGTGVAPGCGMKRIVVGLLVFAGCSEVGDAGGDVDAAAGMDAPARSCTVVEDLGALGARDGTAMASGAAGSRVLSVSMTVAADAATRDVVFVQLKGGRGAFAGGDPTPGTYAITGADAGYTTCGVCVTVIGDLVTGQGPTQFYSATGGTVTITQTEGALVGSLAEVSLQELDLLSETLVDGGCTTRVGGLSFDEALP